MAETTIIRGDTPEGLMANADALISKGWEPAGGPFQWLDGVCWAFYKKPTRKRKSAKEKKK